MIPSLRSQVALLNHLRATMRDSATTRWTDTEFYTSINRALTTWSNRVRVPLLFSPVTLDDSMSYALPVYMDQYIRPQTSDADGEIWNEIQDWTIEPDGQGNPVLYRRAPVTVQNARIIWYMPVFPIPTQVVTLTSTIGTEDTSLTVTTADAYPVGAAGWIKIKNEWMQYAGTERTSAASLTLNGLTRGVSGTSAAMHPADVSVEWGIAVDRDDLWEALADQVMEYLHAYYMTDGSNSERDHHAVMMRYHGDKVAAFWRRYLGGWRPRLFAAKETIGLRTY